MTARTFVDTNVLVYAVDAANPTKQERALSILASPTDEWTLVISPQVLSEFYVVVTRRLAQPLEPAEAERCIHELLRLPVVQTDSDTVLTAIEVAREHRLSLWDAQILIAARTGGCSRLWTEDLQDGFELGGVRVEDPFFGPA